MGGFAVAFWKSLEPVCDKNPEQQHCPVVKKLLEEFDFLSESVSPDEHDCLSADSAPGKRKWSCLEKGIGCMDGKEVCSSSKRDLPRQKREWCCHSTGLQCKGSEERERKREKMEMEKAKRALEKTTKECKEKKERAKYTKRQRRAKAKVLKEANRAKETKRAETEAR